MNVQGSFVYDVSMSNKEAKYPAVNIHVAPGLQTSKTFQNHLPLDIYPVYCLRKG